jgi:mono/diheme cytochrome c family protein
MRLLLKIVGVLLVLLLLVAGGGLAYLYSAYPNVPLNETYQIQPTPERLARGKYLNDHVVGCTACHTERDWTRFSGPIKPERTGAGGDHFALGPAGDLYGKNITPAAIGAWSDAELYRAVTSGVSRDGTPLFPLMPYPHFGVMDDEDIQAVLSYVRSLKPIESTIRPRTLNFPLFLIVRTIPRAAAPQQRPSPDDQLAYGRYMLRSALCADCHTPIDEQGTPLPGMDFAGGMELIETGFRVRTANITPDADTGIGSWTEQQFVDKFKAFDTPDAAPALNEVERRQNTPMPWTAYAGMTREDLAAIYAALRAQKPITNRVTKFPDAQR